MSSQALTSRLPWQDRWTQPTLLQLLEPMKIQHRRLFEQLMEEVAGFEQVDQIIHWYGFAWNWTIQYRLHEAGAAQPLPLMYLVPRVEMPIIVIPLSDQIIEQLPLKRLNRFIRDGIKHAKHAVAIHWATWTPNSKAEVSFLADLLKRKCKLILGAADKAAEASQDKLESEIKPTSKAASQGESPAKPASVKDKAAPVKQGVSKAGVSKSTGGKPASPAGKPGGATKPQAVVKPPAAKSAAKPAASAGKPMGGAKKGKSATPVGKSSGKARPPVSVARKPAGKPTTAKPAAKPTAVGKKSAKPAVKSAPKPAAKPRPRVAVAQSGRRK